MQNSKKYAWHFVRTTSIFVHHGFLYVSRFFLLFETCNLWWSQLPSWRLKKVVKSIQIFLFPFTSHLRKQRWNMKMGDQKTDTQYSLPWSKPLLSMALNPSMIGKIWISAIGRDMIYLGGGFKYVLCYPYLGKWSNLTNIFQMGGSTTDNLSYETCGIPQCPLFPEISGKGSVWENGGSWSDTIQALNIILCKWSPIRWTQNSLTFPLCCWAFVVGGIYQEAAPTMIGMMGLAHFHFPPNSMGLYNSV